VAHCARHQEAESFEDGEGGVRVENGLDERPVPDSENVRRERSGVSAEAILWFIRKHRGVT
jgi:hypothetical protein